MPLTRISLKGGKSPSACQAIMDGVYQAMRATFDVPEDDLFMMLHEHDDHAFVFGRDYLSIHRTDDLIIVQITCSFGRTTQTKAALYTAIVENLRRDPGLRPEDVFINLIEVERANWSFGNGLAQYAGQDKA